MNEQKIKIKAREATPDEIFWRDEQRQLIANGPQVMDNTAQHTITAVSFLTALYTAALSGLDILKCVSLAFQVFSLLPFIAFIAAIVLSFWALFPKTHHLLQDAPEETRQFIQHLTRRKKRLLITAAVFMVLGLVLVVMVFLVYFLL